MAYYPLVRLAWLAVSCLVISTKVSEIIWMMFKTDAPFYLDSDRIAFKTLHDPYRQGVYHNRGIDRKGQQVDENRR